MPGARRRPPDRWKSIGERGYSGSREKRGYFRHFHVAGGGGVIRGTVRCGACVPLCCLRWIGRVRARAAPVPQNAGRFGCFLVGFSPLLFFFRPKYKQSVMGWCVCVCVSRVGVNRSDGNRAWWVVLHARSSNVCICCEELDIIPQK